jgi:hypothetical protein
VVVLPTPPFWFAQAIVWPTQWPAWGAITRLNSIIDGRLTSGPAGIHSLAAGS